MTEARTKLDFATHLDFDTILTNPILDIAARFWESDRYEAFRICYRSMRMIDDLVDDRKATGSAISPEEIETISSQMTYWLQAIGRGEVADDFSHLFLKMRSEFDMPLWPWERLCRAMIYDLRHDGFSNFLTFARYAEGAAIAPAAVFMHLCGLRREDQRYLRPAYDIRLAARALALFSYLVHIIRDFEKDQLRGLNYYADTLLRRHSLDSSALKRIAETGTPTADFRALLSDYYRLAEFYRVRAGNQIARLLPLLQPRYQLSLVLIYELYLQIFERVNPDKGQFTAAALNPTPGDVKARIELTIEHFVPVTPSA